MKDYIELSATTPFDEQCAQLGSDDYSRNARIEANTYINQLIRTFGHNPEGTSFRITQNPHDFGVYLDIRFNFDDDVDMHIHYMQQIEDGIAQWDEEAKKDLREQKYMVNPVKDNVRFLKRRAA